MEYKIIETKTFSCHKGLFRTQHSLIIIRCTRNSIKGANEDYKKDKVLTRRIQKGIQHSFNAYDIHCSVRQSFICSDVSI